MNQRKNLNMRRSRRTRRNRAKVFGTKERPRLAVFRSNRAIYAQLIDDEKGMTLAHASIRDVKAEKKRKSETATLVGEVIARRALEKGIKNAVSDRRLYAYHGRVKALVEGARKAGLHV